MRKNPLDRLRNILYKDIIRILYFRFACATKSENQAVGMEIMKGEWISGQTYCYDKGFYEYPLFPVTSRAVTYAKSVLQTTQKPWDTWG